MLVEQTGYGLTAAPQPFAATATVQDAPSGDNFEFDIVNLTYPQAATFKVKR